MSACVSAEGVFFSSAYGGHGEVLYSSVAFCALWFLSSCYINHNTERTPDQKEHVPGNPITAEPRNAAGVTSSLEMNCAALRVKEKSHSLVPLQVLHFSDLSNSEL